MKAYAICLSMLFLGTVAMASAQVGDYATFTVVDPISGESTWQVKVMDYDQTKDLWTLGETTTVSSGAEQKETSSLTSKDLHYTQADAKNLFDNCASNGGTYEQVTVRAGQFNTCRIDGEYGLDQSRWIAPEVTFGSVKYRWHTTTYILSNYHLTN